MSCVLEEGSESVKKKIVRNLFVFVFESLRYTIKMHIKAVLAITVLVQVGLTLGLIDIVGDMIHNTEGNYGLTYIKRKAETKIACMRFRFAGILHSAVRFSWNVWYRRSSISHYLQDSSSKLDNLLRLQSGLHL